MLYRAVDSARNTIEFMLSAKRDIPAAKRFFKKLMGADHRRLPITTGTDKHASYPEAFATSVQEKGLPSDCKLRRVKYLSNVIEQDHRFIRRRWRAAQCFRSLYTAERAIEGIEALHMMGKGQVKRLDGSDSVCQAKFIDSLFGVPAQQKSLSDLFSLQSISRNTTALPTQHSHECALTALIFHAYSLTPPTVAPGPSFHVVPTVERLGGTDSPDMNALAELLRATD